MEYFVCARHLLCVPDQQGKGQSIFYHFKTVSDCTLGRPCLRIMTSFPIDPLQPHTLLTIDLTMGYHVSISRREDSHAAIDRRISP